MTVNCNANQHIMFSLDVTNMYANIPPNECIQILKNHLNETNLNNDDIKSLCELTEMVLLQNYFVYDSKYYIQNEGLPMGGPLSGYLANMFMVNFEEIN